MQISIRPGTRDDVPLILSFIRELADYEKLSDEVVANEEALGRHLFENRHAEVIIAEAPEPAGFALFFHNFSTFLGRPGIYLEDLYVRPEFRGKGIGKRLLRELARLAVDRDCGRLEWAVLDWNKPSIDFYESLGAGPRKEWVTYRLAGEGLQALANGVG